MLELDHISGSQPNQHYCQHQAYDENQYISRAKLMHRALRRRLLKNRPQRPPQGRQQAGLSCGIRNDALPVTRWLKDTIGGGASKWPRSIKTTGAAAAIFLRLALRMDNSGYERSSSGYDPIFGSWTGWPSACSTSSWVSIRTRILSNRPALNCAKWASRTLIGLFESSAVSEYRIIDAACSSPNMIDSRSKRRTRTFSEICRHTSSTAAFPRRAPRNGNMSIGPWIVQSTSSSIRSS